MRAKGPLRVLVLLLAVSLLPAVAVSAHHGPTVEDVVAEAGVVTPAMTCAPSGGQLDCKAAERALNHHATITPVSGPLASLTTWVNAVLVPTTNLAVYAMAPSDQTWNAGLHGVGCASPNELAKFMATLGADSSVPKKLSQNPLGECAIDGSLVFPVTGAQPYYTITSRELSSALPTPTPTPTPRPTATPTPAPTATPKPTGTPTTRPTATSRASAGATATATATATANQSLSAWESASASASATAIGTPEESVLGFTFTPEPSSAPPAPAGGGGGGWAGSVPSANKVSTDPVKLAGSGLAALLLLLAMGFIGELFNNTFEANYERILAGWQRSWLGKIGKAFSGLWGGGK